MADAVTTDVIADTLRNYVVHFTNKSDATGESGVVKVDISTLVAEDGGAPASLDIEQVEWNMQGFTYVEILYDAATDDTILLLNGTGYKDFRGLDRGVVDLKNTSGLKDPRSTTNTGDIRFTTVGATATSTYNITLWLRKTND